MRGVSKTSPGYRFAHPGYLLIEQRMGTKAARADLHIGISRDGELFLTSRQDGMIRMLVPDGAGTN